MSCHSIRRLPHSIRRLTHAEREARDAYEAYRYDEIMDDLVAKERAEYEEQFGPTYRAKYPFQASHNLHDKVEKLIRQEREENERGAL